MQEHSTRGYKLINFIIGAAIAIILSVLLVLGLRIFIPAPEYPSYKDPYIVCQYDSPDYDSCIQRAQAEEEPLIKNYEKEAKAYGGKVFIASNIVGLIVLLIGIAVFAFGLGTNIAAGFLLAGSFGIIWGYAWGWNGADDKLKFFVGLVVALIVVAGAVVLNRMRRQATEQARMIQT